MRPDHDQKKQAANSALSDLLLDYEQEIEATAIVLDDLRVKVRTKEAELAHLITLRDSLIESREGLANAEVV